jgi:hypothetical protein
LLQNQPYLRPSLIIKPAADTHVSIPLTKGIPIDVLNFFLAILMSVRRRQLKSDMRGV